MLKNKIIRLSIISLIVIGYKQESFAAGHPWFTQQINSFASENDCVQACLQSYPTTFGALQKAREVPIEYPEETKSACANACISLRKYEFFKELKKDVTFGIRHVAISSDNSFIVVGLERKTIIWNIQTKQVLKLDHSDDNVISMAISPDNTFIVTGSINGKVKMWNTQTGELLKTFELLKPSELLTTLDSSPNGIISLAISSNNKFIYTGSWYGQVNMWDIQTGTDKLLKKFKSSNKVISLAISSDDRFIVMAIDHYAVIMDMLTGEVRKTLTHESIKSVAISSDNNLIITRSEFHSHIGRIWDANTGQLLKTFHDVSTIAISPDNNFIVTGSSTNLFTKEENGFKIWDAKTYQLLQTLDIKDYVSKVAISLDSNFIVTGSYSKSGSFEHVKVWKNK